MTGIYYFCPLFQGKLRNFRYVNWMKTGAKRPWNLLFLQACLLLFCFFQAQAAEFFFPHYRNQSWAEVSEKLRRDGFTPVPNSRLVHDAEGTEYVFQASTGKLTPTGKRWPPLRAETTPLSRDPRSQDAHGSFGLEGPDLPEQSFRFSNGARLDYGFGTMEDIHYTSAMGEETMIFRGKLGVLSLEPADAANYGGDLQVWPVQADGELRILPIADENHLMLIDDEGRLFRTSIPWQSLTHLNFKDLPYLHFQGETYHYVSIQLTSAPRVSGRTFLLRRSDGELLSVDQEFHADLPKLSPTGRLEFADGRRALDLRAFEALSPTIRSPLPLQDDALCVSQFRKLGKVPAPANDN